MFVKPFVADTRPHWLNAERLRVYPWLFIAMYLLLGVGWVLLSKNGIDHRGKPLGYDFITFWAASDLALQGRAAAAYDLEAIVQVERSVAPGIATAYSWHYPPMFYLMVMPLALLPYATSYLLFVGITLLGYGAMLRRVLPAPNGWVWLLAFPGTMLNAVHGQNGFLTAMLMAGGLLTLRRMPWLAGLCFGLLTIKPHMGLLIPVALAAAGQWRCFLSASLSSAAFLGVSLGVLGVDTFGAFWQRLPQVGQWVVDGALPLIKIPSAFSCVLQMGGPVELAYALQGLLAVVAVGGVWWLWRRPAAWALRYAGLTTASLLVSPYLFDYDLAWVAMPIAWFITHAISTGWQRGEREVLIAVWLLPALLPVFGLARMPFVAPLMMLSLFLMILGRAWQEAGDAARRMGSGPVNA